MEDGDKASRSAPRRQQRHHACWSCGRILAGRCESDAGWTQQRTEDGDAGTGVTWRRGDFPPMFPSLFKEIRAKYPEVAALVPEITNVARAAVAAPVHDDARRAERQTKVHRLRKPCATTTGNSRRGKPWRTIKQQQWIWGKKGKRRAPNSLALQTGWWPRGSRHQPSRNWIDELDTQVQVNWTRPWTMPAALLLAVSPMCEKRSPVSTAGGGGEDQCRVLPANISNLGPQAQGLPRSAEMGRFQLVAQHLGTNSINELDMLWKRPDWPRN